jgi:nitroreductase
MKFNLSEINNLIKNRRTIYPEFYSDRQVHLEQVEAILSNAIWAPTHGNTQPWRFHVYSDNGRIRLSDFLKSLYLELVPKENQNEMKLKKLTERPLKSSVVVIVSMERDKTGRILEIEEIEAVSCAIQNMYLTCTAYGIGGFWSTPKIIYSKEMNDFLNLTEEDKCLGLFYLGYPSNEWPKGHRKPIEYVTKWITE